jgi:hypothetical protein
MGEPATTGEVFSVFVVASAADVVTVPAAVGFVHAPVIAVLQGVSAATVAVLLTDAPAAVEDATVPPIATDAVAPFARVANVQETA